VLTAVLFITNLLMEERSRIGIDDNRLSQRVINNLNREDGRWKMEEYECA